VTNADEAVRRFHADRPAAVLLDVVMPGSMDGLAALAAFKKIDKDVPVIVISGQGRTNTIVQAMKLGASDFVCKPFEDAELEVLLGNALKQRQLTQEVATLRQQLNDQSRYTMLFGNSERMVDVRDLIERVSDTDVTILIRGESGTGKELLARAVHETSNRAGKPYVKVHCAALSASLLESELFGHVKGAFTGAHRDKVGRFELANGGTLFLDEIGDVTLEVQTKLLRVLQEKTIERVGSADPMQVDVRIIAATHQDLERLIRQGRFREDLFYRLNVFPIEMPPLRERPEDVAELAMHFIRQSAQRCHKQVHHIDDDTLAVLKGHSWPGNIRQLENVIERAVVIAERDTITVAELPHELFHEDERDEAEEELMASVSRVTEPATPGYAAWRSERQRLERDQLVRALAAANGNKAEAARALGIARSTLVSRLKKLRMS
jgi:DNA-binding NtrC family response regulator